MNDFTRKELQMIEGDLENRILNLSDPAIPQEAFKEYRTFVEDMLKKTKLMLEKCDE